MSVVKISFWNHVKILIWKVNLEKIFPKTKSSLLAKYIALIL